MTTSSALPQIDETLLATTRYLQALTVLDDESVRRPSVLPGWTRAHVVAHLSRNADAFTRVLAQVAAGEPASMYPSSEARDAEIEETVRSRDLAGLVEDATASVARLTEAFWACTADPATPYARTADGEATFALHTLGPRRRAEVEIHHADLDLGYEPATWPPDFSRAMVSRPALRRTIARGMARWRRCPVAGRRWCSAPPTSTGSGGSATARDRRSAAPPATWPGGWSVGATGAG